MFRLLNQFRRSPFIITSRTISTENILKRDVVAATHLDDLPTAKRFLGIVDLELLRHPMSKFHEFFCKRSKQLGEMYAFQPFFFSPKQLVISTPSLLAELSAKEGKSPYRGNTGLKVRKAMEMLGLKKGIIFSDGAEWKRLRDPLSKRLLRPKFISGYFPKLSEIAKCAVIDIIDIQGRGQKNFDPIVERLRLWTVNSANYMAFHIFSGTELTEEISEYFQAMMSIIRGFADTKDIELLPYFQRKKIRKLIESLQTVIKYNNKQIQVSATLPKDPDREQITMLEYLQAETDFDEKEIINTFISLLGAGVDTTSNSTQWLWYNLAKNLRVQDKLCEEVHSVIGDSSVVTAEHFNKLHYMKMCLKESMRVTPIVGSFARILPEESTIGGVCIPKNTQVFADIYGIGLNENYWRDPLEFIPERWENRKEIDPFSFIPFGTGPRMCVGRRIAEAQMQLITAHLCSSYKLHLIKEPDPKFEVLIKPEGLNLSFEKRV